MAGPHADILTPPQTPQRPRNDPELDTSSIPPGGRVVHLEPPAGAQRVKDGMVGPGNGGRMPFRIVGGG